MLFQTASHPVFQLLAQMVHVCLHPRKRVHNQLSEKNRTQRLTRRNRGLPSLDHSAALCRQRNTLYSATLLYTYISRFSVNPQHQQKRKIWQSCCHKFYPPTVFHPVFQLLAQMAHVRSHGRKWVHPRFCSEDRTQGHTRRNRGRFRWGWYHYPRSVPHVSETLRGRVSERRTLLLWELGQVRSRRTQKASGTAMRLCASLSRGVAAPLGCVIFFRFCRNCGLYILRTDMVVGAHSSVLYIDNHLVHKYKTCYLCVCGFFQQNQNARIQKFNLVNL